MDELAWKQPDVYVIISSQYNYNHALKGFYNFLTGPCFYTGNSQGEKSVEYGDHESVIMGKFTDYIVDGLFETKFIYSQFDEDQCSTA